MTAPLPTPDEVEGMRERHGEHAQSAVGKCRWCGVPWPCDAARLLALVDTLSSTVTDLELANSRIRDRENEARGRLAAVLAECDRAPTSASASEQVGEAAKSLDDEGKIPAQTGPVWKQPEGYGGNHTCSCGSWWADSIRRDR